MKHHLKSWTIAGNGNLDEFKIPFFGWIYWRKTVQKWSPLMHEITIEYGIRFGALRLGSHWTEKHFFDNKEPAVIAGEY